MTYIPGQGNRNAKLMVVGEFPNEIDERNEKPFAGKDGEVLDRIFNELDINPNDLYFTNVYKYRPPFNSAKRLKEVQTEKEAHASLWQEIQEINPNCILALGDIALTAVAGQSKVLTWRGSILPSINGNPKVVSSIHPHNLSANKRRDDDDPEFTQYKSYNYIWNNILKLDIARAYEESKVSRYSIPQRLLRVARNSVDVYRFIRDHRSLRPYVDIETFQSTIPTCVALSYDEYEGLSIPLFQKLGNVNLCSIPHTDLAFIWSILYDLFSTTLVGGQNFKFDQQKMEMQGFKFKGIFTDTMLKAHTVNPEMPSFSQAFLASIYTREPYYKDEGKEFVYNKHSIDRLFLYNAKDTAVCAEIDKNLDVELRELSEYYKTDLVKFYNEYVNKQHAFYLDMEKTGFKVDEFQRKFLIDKYEHWAENVQIKIEALIGHPININSPKQVATLVYDELGIQPYRWGGKVKRDTNEDTIAKLLKDRVKDKYRTDILTALLEQRRVKKTLSTYLYADSDYDGKLRSQWRIIGTENGRSSTTIVRPPVRPFENGFAFQTLTKHGDIGSDIRSYLLPDDGFILVNIDLSQAEARVVSLLSEDYEILEAFGKIDLHRRMAACALFTGRLNLSPEFDPIADILGKDSPERFIGKKAKHATNYDMKSGRFVTEVTADARRFKIDITISPFKAKQIIERIHAATPKTKSVFHKGIQECIDTRKALISASGRLRRFFGRVGDSLYQEAYAYIPQDSVKYILTTAGLDQAEKNYPIRICGEAHDALTYMMPKNEYKDICKEIKGLFERPLDFSGCSLPRGKLVIPCDFEVGENYKDLEKLKW